MNNKHKHEPEAIGEMLFYVNPLSPIIVEKCKHCGAFKFRGRWYIEEF